MRMSWGYHLFGACLWLLWNCSSLYAQEQAPLTLMFGQSVTGAASAQGGDLYQFIGFSGTKVRARVTVAAQGHVTLYTPEGLELLHARGEESIELEAELNEDAMYFLSVISLPKGPSYTLMLEETVSEIAVQFDAVIAEQSSAVVPADVALWGLYAKLLGQYRKAEGGYRLHWRWEVPHKIIVEEWMNPENGKVSHTNALHLGSEPGRLILKASHPGGDRTGKIETDNAVVFDGAGFFAKPYRAQLTADGDLEVQTLKMRGGVMQVVGSQRYTLLQQ